MVVESPVEHFYSGFIEFRCGSLRVSSTVTKSPRPSTQVPSPPARRRAPEALHPTRPRGSHAIPRGPTPSHAIPRGPTRSHAPPPAADCGVCDDRHPHAHKSYELQLYLITGGFNRLGCSLLTTSDLAFEWQVKPSTFAKAENSPSTASDRANIAPIRDKERV